MQITITYESNWQKAEKIIHEILLKETKEFTAAARKQQSKRTYLYYIPVEPSDGIVYTDIASSGVTFTLRFNVPIGFRRDVATKVSKDILKKFGKEKDIQLAYSTVRVVGGR
jgi:small-conductance mechanosensitive channel